ncbi:TPA: YopX family protein [Streptococcus suis]
MIPKFRAWDVHNKKMLVVNDICNLFWENTFFECYELVPDPKGKREYELINHRIDFEDCVLMQSTGLFDVNGKEIFEGDVVKLVDEYGDSGMSKVTSQEGALGMVIEEVFVPFATISILSTVDYTLEIIGNSHQNPELMEVNND